LILPAKFVIDTDPRVDDAVALVLTFGKKNQIISVSCVDGNIPIEVA